VFRSSCAVSSSKRSRACRIAAVAVLALTLTAGLSACGGGDGASSEELVKAEKRGRHYRMEQERKRRIERELKELRKAQKQGSGAPSQAPAITTAPAPTTAPSSSRSSCGGSLEVGPATTCAFAENVRYEYESEIGSGSGTVYAYSAANDEIYEMYCTSAPHECSGAISATVYFP
jgi:hypothetical protein